MDGVWYWLNCYDNTVCLCLVAGLALRDPHLPLPPGRRNVPQSKTPGTLFTCPLTAWTVCSWWLLTKFCVNEHVWLLQVLLTNIDGARTCSWIVYDKMKKNPAKRIVYKIITKCYICIIDTDLPPTIRK